MPSRFLYFAAGLPSKQFQLPPDGRLPTAPRRVRAAADSETQPALCKPAHLPDARPVRGAELQSHNSFLLRQSRPPELPGLSSKPHAPCSARKEGRRVTCPPSVRSTS